MGITFTSIILGESAVTEAYKKKSDIVATTPKPLGDHYTDLEPCLRSLTDRNSSRPITLDAQCVANAVKNKTNFEWGPDVPLLPPNVALTGFKNGEVRLFTRGIDYRWPNMPEDSSGPCLFIGRGIILIPEKGVHSRIVEALRHPENHPTLLPGIDRSKRVGERKPTQGNEVDRFDNLAATRDFQHLADTRIFNAGHGTLFFQKTLDGEIGHLPMDVLYKDEKWKPLPIHDLNGFVGRLQVLEIANGTLLIMEARSNYAKTPPVVTCNQAADTTLAGVRFSEKGLAQRIEDRLRTLAHLLTDPKWEKGLTVTSATQANSPRASE